MASPLTDDMLAPSISRRGFVQFDRRLTDADFERLAAWMRGYPEMTLRAYGSYDRSITDLEFLRFFPTLRRFDADALFDSLGSLDGLRHLPEDLEELAIGATRRPLDLATLRRFRALTFLYLERQTKHLEVISELTSLEALALRSITLPDLSRLLPLRGLRSLELKLGGTNDLRLLPRIGDLAYLELWLIRGLVDIGPVADLAGLRFLFLQALRRVERLPDLAHARSLRRVHLETMKGLRDLRPLASAPALEELLLIDMPQLEPEDVLPLVGHPTLKGVTAGLSSRRGAAGITRMLGLPAAGQRRSWSDL